MLARQEAGIAFEATLQVRNRLLSAYRTRAEATLRVRMFHCLDELRRSVGGTWRARA